MIKENSCFQLRVLIKVLSIACLSGMALCYKLWLGERNFPVSPVVPLLQLKHPLDLLLPSLSAIFLFCSIVSRLPRKCIIGFLITAILLCLMDMNRWQPWFYQYILMFFVLSFFNYNCDDPKLQQSIITVFKVMIAAIYFWSGLQKLNPHFLTDTFPWLMEPITEHLGANSLQHFQFLGYAFPLIETVTGICLLIPALQKLSAVIAVLMHLFILFVLSPLGHNYNPVVWPWNIAMIVFILILFYKEPPFNFNLLKNALSYFYIKVVILFFVLFPLLNFFNLWDSYLSHNLYSGNTANGIICVSDSLKNNLPAYIQPYAVSGIKDNQINIKYWCMQELGVPAYPEKRNFKAVAQTLYSYTGDSSQLYLVYSPKLKMNQK